MNGQRGLHNMSVGISNICKYALFYRTYKVIIAIIQEDPILLQEIRIGILYSSRDYFMKKQGQYWGTINKWKERL